VHQGATSRNCGGARHSKENGWGEKKKAQNEEEGARSVGRKAQSKVGNWWGEPLIKKREGRGVRVRYYEGGRGDPGTGRGGKAWRRGQPGHVRQNVIALLFRTGPHKCKMGGGSLKIIPAELEKELGDLS